MYSTLCPFFSRHHSQVVRQRPAKPLCPSSNLGGASNKAASLYETCRFFFCHNYLLIFAFPAHLCRDFLLLFGKRGSAAQGRWRSRLSRVGSCKQKEKTLRKKPQCLLAQKERLDRALPCLFAARTIPFYVSFCCAKRWTVAFSSLPGEKLQTKRKGTKENP